MAHITWYAKEELVEAAQSRVHAAPVVLDVGCGIRPQRLVPCALHICIEPFGPYIDIVREHNADGPTHLILQGTWDTIMPIFPLKSVDIVVAGDLIEHLDKQAGWRFLAEAERVARRQICVFTPLGYFPQHHEAGKPDRWGLQGGFWQAHRSGWMPDEFGDGWECLCCDAYHENDEDEQPLEKPFGAFYAIRSF